MNKIKYLCIIICLFSMIVFINRNYNTDNNVTFNPYIGKKVSVLGDSISTYKGNIYIDSDNSEINNNINIELKDIWWYKIASKLNMKIGYASSLGGSRVSNTFKYNKGTNLGVDRSLSSIYRIKSISKNGNPDLILFYGGTNDIPNEKLGKFDINSEKLKSVDLTSEVYDNFVDAYITALKRIKYYYPNAELVVLLPTYTNGYYTDTKLNKFNYEIIKICNYLNIKYVDLRKCITKDIIDLYLYDGLHPNKEGMELISNCTINSLDIDTYKLNSFHKYLKNTIE